MRRSSTVGYYASYATSHRAPDAEQALFEERPTSRALLERVEQLRQGQLEAGADLAAPRLLHLRPAEVPATLMHRSRDAPAHGERCSMIVGIDLGTTHSLIGAYSDAGTRLFPNPLGELLTPSVVSVDASGVMIGAPALDRLVTHPGQTVAAFKRWMGSDRETRLGDRSFRPEELSALVLRSLIADAEAATGEKVEEAVISVPAYFSDAQRKATRAAGQLAGIRVERLINEPTAAALAYGLQEREGEHRFLVLDLGGGTFDVSILEMFEGVVEVHASAGDNFLGGEDFTDLLQNAFLADHGIQAKGLDRRELAKLRRTFERAKRELTTTSSVEVLATVGDRDFNWSIDETRFASLAEPLLQRMRGPVERAMRDARMAGGQLDQIVLVGGASRMPLVSRMVTRMFGRLPMRHVNPDHAIAMGATIAAAMKVRDQRLEEVILTDVCPYTLGTQVARRDQDGSIRTGFFHPIIQRNSAVPVSREDQFFPVHDGQETLIIDVYQGESPTVDKNVKLGELRIQVDPRRRMHENGVTVRFTYDVNGLLQVEVTEQVNGRTHELLLEQNPGLLSADELRQRFERLAELKIHPRDQLENVALLARAERLYEELLDQRGMLQDWIARFRQTLDTQDLALIKQHRVQLGSSLESLEAGP